MEHMLRRTLEDYAPEEGRKANLWPLVANPEEFFEDVQRASLNCARVSPMKSPILPTLND